MTAIPGSDYSSPSAVAAEDVASAVSWPSVFAGTVVAIASTLILVAIGSGLGFASASPWPGGGPSATSFAIGAGIWFIVTQWLASFLGGYITGRLRTRWTSAHRHEVFFRDTAHGFLTWSLATTIVAAVALSAGMSAAGTATSAASNSIGYATDTLLRSDRAEDGASAAATRAQIGRILAREGGMAADDQAYLASLVASRTGLSRAEARQRVDDAAASVRAAADKARKVSSTISFFTALSMLVGAFIAAVAAAYGGSLRDDAAEMTGPA